MNGTAVMTALACLASERAARLARLAAALTALASQVSRGNPGHFDARIFAWKPHPGSARVAEWIRGDLESAGPPPGAPGSASRIATRCAARPT